MKLDEFVTESLKQIFSGVEQAQDFAIEKGGTINPAEITFSGGETGAPIMMVPYKNVLIQNIEFDVVVTTSDKHGGEGGAGIFVGPITIGAKGTAETQNQSVSRLRFRVPLVLPYRDKDPDN